MIEEESNTEEQATEEVAPVLEEGATSFREGDGVVQEREAPAPEPVPRPNDILEQHWDSDKGEVRVDALTKSFKDTKAKLDSRRDESGVPRRASEYFKYNEDDSIMVNSEFTNLPPIFGNDPILSEVAKAAHEADIPLESFETVINSYFKAQDDFLSQNKPPEFNEMEVLAGVDQDADRARNTIAGVNVFLDSLGLSEGENALTNQLLGTSDGINMISKLMRARDVEPIKLGAESTNVTNEMNTELLEQWHRMRKDKDRLDMDSTFRAQFEEIGAKIFG